MKNILKTVAICFVLLAGFSLTILSNHIVGWQAFIVKTGSMEPTIHVGSLVITRKVHPSELKEQDIITFIKPSKTHEFITHRITTITKNESLLILKTKGDYNKVADPWKIAAGSVVGKVVLTLPYLGYFFSFAQSKTGIFLLILIPAILIIIDEISNIHALMTNRHKKTIPQTPMICLLIVSAILSSVQSTYAYLNDSVSLTNNNFRVESNKESCHEKGTTVIISNNGAGSINSVSITNSSNTIINQSSTTIINNSVSLGNSGSENKLFIQKN